MQRQASILIGSWQSGKYFTEKYGSKYTNTRSALRKEMEGQKEKADGRQGVYLFAAFNSMF